MSRHIFDSTLEGQPIRILVGYDRPTGEFYLHIGWIDPQSNTIAAYASNLGLAYDPRDLKTIRAFLRKLEILIPESVWVEVAYDAARRNGNRVVRHLSDGTMRELPIS